MCRKHKRLLRGVPLWTQRPFHDAQVVLSMKLVKWVLKFRVFDCHGISLPSKLEETGPLQQTTPPYVHNLLGIELKTPNAKEYLRNGQITLSKLLASYTPGPCKVAKRFKAIL